MSTNTTLFIKNMVVPVLIGVWEEERHAPQKIVFNLEIKLRSSTQKKIKDSIRSTVDYSAICELIRERCQATSYQLLEALAADLSTHIEKKFKGISEIKIQLEKKNFLKDVESLGIHYTKKVRS